MINLILVPSCLSPEDASKHIQVDIERSMSKFVLRSRSRGDPSRPFAHDSMPVDERNTMRSLPRLYLFWIKSYWQKTVGDLGWPQMSFWRVTDENWHMGHHWWAKATPPSRVNGNVSMQKRGSWDFAHWLNVGRSRNWPDHRSRLSLIQDIQVVSTIDFIKFYRFENIGFRTVAVEGCQPCYMAFWSDVT